MTTTQSLFDGFSKLRRVTRLDRLHEASILTHDDIDYLTSINQSYIVDIAEKLAENVIGCFQLPLGVAPHFRIDGKDYTIPMAIEETSVVAAASGTAKWLRDVGTITTETIGNCVIGQIQIARVTDLATFKTLFETHKQNLIAMANNSVIPGLLARGGGIQDIIIRDIPRENGEVMVVLHVLINTCDAMGANLTNQVCEFLRDPIQKLTHQHVNLCIISNLTDHKLTRAKIEIFDISPDLGAAIAEASLFAELDPYRAATNNKGVLNGIDAVLIATGNDWRAVEAGIHAYAVRSGQYRPITHWQMKDKSLIGTFEAPIIVGIVGGVTNIHPTAKLCLRILNVEHADQLARILAAVGLVQNLGALRALTTDGIVKGHMKLHVNNLLLAAETNETEQSFLKIQIENFLKINKKITLTDVKKMQMRLREQK